MSTLLDTDRLRELAREGEERFTALEAELGGTHEGRVELGRQALQPVHLTQQQRGIVVARIQAHVADEGQRQPVQVVVQQAQQPQAGGQRHQIALTDAPSGPTRRQRTWPPFMATGSRA